MLLQCRKRFGLEITMKNEQAERLLKKIIERGHYVFADSADDWRSALRMSCRPLIEDGTVSAQYAEDIVECVEKYGPYIVLFPGVAMPHAQEGGAQVNGTEISFMKLQTPVVFDPEDEDSYADLFFTLAARDPEEHLENMKSLMEILTDEELVERLHALRGIEELKQLV